MWMVLIKSRFGEFSPKIPSADNKNYQVSHPYTLKKLFLYYSWVVFFKDKIFSDAFWNIKLQQSVRSGANTALIEAV